MGQAPDPAHGQPFRIITSCRVVPEFSAIRRPGGRRLRLWSFPASFRRCARDEMDLVAVAAHDIAGHIVGDDPVGAFAAALGDGMFQHIIGLRGKADQQTRALLVLRQARRECRDFRPAGGRRPRPLFLILLLLAMSGRQSATAAAITAISAGSSASQAASISRAVVTRCKLDAEGAGSSTGPDTSTRVGARPRQGRGDGIALLAGGAVGEEAHRIERLMRRPRRHQRFEPSSGPGVAKRAFDRGHDLQRLGHAARTEFTARHLAVIGADEETPSRFKVAKLRRAGGLCHMRTFIAGAIRIFLSVASSAVDARSLASPPPACPSDRR